MSANFISKYASNLLPTFKKDKLTEDARLVSTELNTNTIPSYKFSADLFQTKKIKSTQVLNFQKQYFSILGGNNNKGMVADIADRLENVQKTVDFIERATEKNFETSVVIDGITLYKVSLIKALELCSFISRYSLRFLNYLYILETSATSKDPSYTTKELSKGVIKELELFFNDYCKAIKSLSKDPKSFEKELDNLPGVTISDSSEVTLTNIGSVKLDPTNLFATNGFIQPVYRIGMMIAEYQVARYKEAVELKTNLELRKMFLESLKSSGTQDQGIQKEIDTIQSRIDRCSEQIKKAEEKVGM